MAKFALTLIALAGLVAITNAFAPHVNPTQAVVQKITYRQLSRTSSAQRTTINRYRLFSGATDNSDTSVDLTMPSEPASISTQSVAYQIVTIIGKSASSLVSISFFLLLATRRDALVLTLFIGSIVNAVSSKVVKKLLNHERPANLQLNENVKLKPSDGGMPSSHAMSLGFIGTVITCAIIPASQQNVVGPAMIAYALLALRYRIRDHLHTLEQVIVGLIFGIINAALWLKYALGLDAGHTGPVMTWVKQNFVSSETGLFPYAGLAIPIVVGVLVVGSFERRIALWMKEKKVNKQN